MGCDIHFYVEKKVGKKWQSCDRWTPDKYSDTKRLTVSHKDHYYDQRNYVLFSALAGVRNDSKIKPIRKPRGFPRDACALLRSEYDNGGDHTASWVTLAEILKYDWTKVYVDCGWIRAVDYKQWKAMHAYDRYPYPKEWCLDVGGAARKVSNSEMDSLIEGKEYHELNGLPFHSIYTHCSWNFKLSEYCEKFWGVAVPELLRAAKGKYESVRAVFWFDS